jgi:hypothetical protein
MKMKLAILLATALCSTVSHAWGPREQAALAGFIGGAIVGTHSAPPSVYVYHERQPPVGHRFYSPRRPTYRDIYPQQYPQTVPQQCVDEYYYDNQGQLIGSRRICR